MRKFISVMLVLLGSQFALASGTSDQTAADSEIVSSEAVYPGSYYNWGRGRNGFGYCYEWTNDGRVLNGGQPVSNFYCESYSPSYYAWGTGRNGYTYCYQWAAYNLVLNEGQPVSNFYCR